jgi:hypothetical protein
MFLMRSVFAALGYSLVFGAVVGVIWLRYPPSWTALDQASTIEAVSAFVAIEPNGDLRHSVAFWSRH